MLKTMNNVVPETIDERIGRRNYLKYLGVAAVVAGAAAIGAYEYSEYYGKQAPSPLPTINPKPTTPVPIPTKTVELTSLYGRLFFDYNGNGVHDGKEPAVSNAKVQLKDDTGKVIAEAVTNSSGDYKVEDVPTGSYRLHVHADEKFRYMCQSAEEFRTVTEDYDILLGKNSRMDVGLMEGFLTLPYKPGTPVCIISYFDLSGNSFDNVVRNWMGNTSQVYDWHCGIDYGYGENTKLCGMEVYSAAPGEVIAIGPVNPPSGGSVRLLHSDGRKTDYAHLGKIFVKNGESVPRGRLLGTTYCDWDEPHLHFELMGKEGEGRLQWEFWRIDVYRDQTNPNSKSFWTVDNNPQYASQYT